LKVVDSAYLNNTTDGAVASWSIDLQTLSSKKIQIKGDLILQNGLQLGTDAAVCAAAKAGTVRYSSGNMEFCNGTAWTSLSGVSMMPAGSRPFLYGYQIDRVEGQWYYKPAYQYAHSFGVDNQTLYGVVDRIVYGDKYGNYFQGLGGDNYGNGNNDYTRQYLVAFIKNTTASAINRNVNIWWAANPWAGGNYAGIAVNGTNFWSSTANSLGQQGAITLTFPANQTSVVVVKVGGYMWTTWNGYWNKSIIGYYGDCWNIAGTGLEFDYKRYEDFLANK
jgi:hypothetical protein